MAGKVYTDASKWADAVRRWEQREKDKPIFSAVRKAGGLWRKLAIQEFGKNGVGAKVVKSKVGRRKWWGIAFDRVKKLGETRFEAGLLLYGLAAHQELGTRTVPHKIQGTGNLLVFKGTGKRVGDSVGAKLVNHPGGPVPRHPFAERTARQVEPRLRELIQAGVAESYAKVVG